MPRIFFIRIVTKILEKFMKAFQKMIKSNTKTNWRIFLQGVVELSSQKISAGIHKWIFEATFNEFSKEMSVVISKTITDRISYWIAERLSNGNVSEIRQMNFWRDLRNHSKKIFFCLFVCLNGSVQKELLKEFWNYWLFFSKKFTKVIFKNCRMFPK